MIIRSLNTAQYERLCHDLQESAHAEPLDASYTLRMTVNGAEYAVKLQPEAHNKIAVLQALRMFRGQSAPDFELITHGGLLSAFLELLLYQGACR